MDKQINQISLNIALNLLGDQIKERCLQLTQIHQKFAREFVSKQEVDLHQWLLGQTKSINETVRSLVESTKEYFTDIKFDFVYEFFEKCLTVMEQNCRYLSQAIIERINKKIDVFRSHVFVPSPPTIVGTNEKEADQLKDDKMKRHSKQINRDLESLDYFLNLLTYEDSKTYEEYKKQCDKILMQRQMIDSIKASDASKEIMETANMIDNVMENSDKIFNNSYLLKYMEFKSFLNDLIKPENLDDLYKEDMENATKEKFKQGMSRTLKKCYAISKKQNLKNQVGFGTQTDEVKVVKYQQKLQNLLIAEKKNNEKLTSQIMLLRKNKPSQEDQLTLQKVIEQAQIKQKEAENKYKILQSMYNQKCEQLLNSPQQKIFIPQSKKLMNSISIQVQKDFHSKNQLVQTDLDFYYYYESNKIYDLKVKILGLEEELKHKAYVIKEMEAIRTFRDNFKSKKQVYSTAIRNARTNKRTKSLHYLNEDDQVFDVRVEEKQLELSFQGQITKKKVTLQDIDENGEARNLAISQGKKNKKKTDNVRNKPYFAINAKIQDEEESEQRSECELQKVSIKSILKLGSNQFKKQIGIQTQSDCLPDFVIQHGIGRSKIQKVKLSSREKSERPKQSKSNIRESEFISLFGEPKEKSSDVGRSLRKSNFVALGQLNDHREEKQMALTMGPSQLRMSSLVPGILASPKRVLQPKTDKLNYFSKPSKWIQSKVNTVGNEVLHVNNSLNCNFLAPITTNLKQSVSNPNFFKNKSKHETLKKSTKQPILI